MKMSSDSVPSTVVDVLQQFTKCSNDCDWVIKRHAVGAQASIFAVRRRDGQPIWQRHLEVVVKLYKKPGQQSAEVACDQFASLSRLHTRLSKSIFTDWTVESPVPLYQCDLPLALVMTMVPGRPLKTCLRAAAQVGPNVLESIAEAVITVMGSYWSAEDGLYGELNFDNILCDVSRKSLSFVDPGSLEKAPLCDTVAKAFYPASRDLAYLLYDIQTSVRTTIGHPGARKREKRLAENVLRAFVKRIAPETRAHSLLDEISACAHVHLKRIRPSWSPRGIWRLFVRQIATRGIDQILERLRTDAVAPMTGSLAAAVQGRK